MELFFDEIQAKPHEDHELIQENSLRSNINVIELGDFDGTIMYDS